MQTNLIPDLLATSQGQRAEQILRKCVHCGFCTATCPTYQLLGDELDGPRGRIYQIKQILEGQEPGRQNQIHLDRCLTCRSCETTCPSGVNYAELVDIGRNLIEAKDLRPPLEKISRRLLGALLPWRSRNHLLFKMASLLRPLMPRVLRVKTPQIRATRHYPELNANDTAQPTVLLLEGCVQSTLSPNTNAAAAFVLQALGYRVIRENPVSCCGAVNHHLNQTEQAEARVIDNLQQWQSLDQNQGLDAIVSTASGCGIMLKDYPAILEHIPGHKDNFVDLLGKIRDISELFDAAALRQKYPDVEVNSDTIAYHAPCTLNHGHRLAEQLFEQLTTFGYRLEKPRDAHMCCGSAGTYSLLQPAISDRLLENKLEALQACVPQQIITANVGCEHHLNSAGDTPVVHWIELVANDLRRSVA